MGVTYLETTSPLLQLLSLSLTLLSLSLPSPFFPFPTGAYKTRDWFQNPGYSQLANATLAPVLDAYVAALVGAHGGDARVVGWDAMFQPQLSDTDPVVKTFLGRVLAALNAGVNSTQAYVTVTVIPGAAACDNLAVSGRAASPPPSRVGSCTL